MQSVQDSKPVMNRLDFRSALVIEESHMLRQSIIEHVKNKGWNFSRNQTRRTSYPGFAAHPDSNRLRNIRYDSDRVRSNRP